MCKCVNCWIMNVCAVCTSHLTLHDTTQQQHLTPPHTAHAVPNQTTCARHPQEMCARNVSCACVRENSAKPAHARHGQAMELTLLASSALACIQHEGVMQ